MEAARKVLLGLAVTAGLGLIPTAVWAADWVYVTGDSEAMSYVDKSSISRNGNIVRAWDRVAYVNHATYNEMRSLTEYNCVTRQSRRLAITGYYKDGSNLSGSHSNWSYVIPDSVGEIMLNYVCSR